MKTKIATKVVLCSFLYQTADSRCKHKCRAYAATISVAGYEMASFGLN